MKALYVDQINERQTVETVLLVREKNLAMAKNGKPYMTLKLMDRSGEIEGRIWDRVEELSAHFGKDDFIQVRGKSNLYLGKMQLVVQDLQKQAEETVDLGDFLPVSERSPEDMRAELDGLLDSLENPHIEALLRAFFDDPDFYQRYSQAPAAKGMHHVYLGGLLEHSLAVSALACDLAVRYPQIDRDLLLSGTLLHDVGKVAELSYRRSFDYTDEGKLLGHIMIGVQMIEDRVRQLPDFPEQLAVMVKHLLLSHHGQYEFGSPKRPKFLEAIVLNFIDDLDSKINGVLSHVAREPQKEGNWTSYHRLYDRYFYTGPGSEEAESPTHSEPAAPPAAPAHSHAKAAKQQRPAKRDYNKPLGVSLGEQLQQKNLDLFGSGSKGPEE